MSTSIKRGEGFTATERTLAGFANRSFLRLWSYPNTFNDRTKSSSGGGQEIADLMVVFARHVLIFSDKDITWQTDNPTGLAWSRWYRRAVNASIGQLVGAERWLDLHPDRIFIDKQCEQRLPIALPPKKERITYLIAVANGGNAASRKYFGHARGTFMIEPSLKGGSHVDLDRKNFRPFTVGDANPDGTFVHVFDQAGLEPVMRELDTVTDFTNYLDARARFLRSGRLAIAAGEDDLIATYMMNAFTDGKAAFVPKKLRIKARRNVVTIPEGQYETYVSSTLYQEFMGAKESSRLWDRVIEMISDDVLKGTSIELLGHAPSTELSERGLRVMAAENRMNRIHLAQILWSALERAVDEGFARFIRRAMIARSRGERNVGYVFLSVAYDKNLGTVDEYRKYRGGMLETYCLAFFSEQPQLETVVGIALDIYRGNGEIRSRSEDLLVMDAPDWTPELEASFATNREAFGLADPKDLESTFRRGRRIKSPFRVKRQKRR
ncbi:MAG: hypothetical protein EOR30_15590 [Mesorhizobium sp.]|uniref:hypothetical protein n=1 Tax=unclassified Mesorhizobium TaxID=325217 RepID=UPI000FCB2161|nr:MULTISPECIES: hypothetical protein [unclassified Mesorhizobium]RUV73466.1 hypothetical protein EOA78_11635 [Mesorhizobium sp. M5C.F.Cr.IN.023.01.1.1]RWF86477.1 MAG: hypothetical protein EOQ36_17195 [Mesorhizobium sp.]RWF93800.1 MAG: hypothetical protein EOQ45_15050 [Mesorhizobium sp.]RWI35311.1 MAG: hypothetical protein EOR14_29215 [Mesorhizobium sp.]RWI53715.1 MAG: hypothetical protein EOR15_03190 [Mesorhizobium sp.]